MLIHVASKRNNRGRTVGFLYAGDNQKYKRPQYCFYIESKIPLTLPGGLEKIRKNTYRIAFSSEHVNATKEKFEKKGFRFNKNWNKFLGKVLIDKI